RQQFLHHDEIGLHALPLTCSAMARASRARLVMASHWPAAMSASGATQEPPTATTLVSLRYSAQLPASTPPVGQNARSGNGPASARSVAMPPMAPAGKNLTKRCPAASAVIASVAVAMPGSSGTEDFAASSAGTDPGLTANLAPMASAARRSATVSTVPR